MSDPTAPQPGPAASPHQQAQPAQAFGQQPTAQQPAGQQAFAASAEPPPGSPLARRVLGIQPVLLVGIVLLTLVTLLTIVLIFVGDIETQAPRVVWTVIAFIGFTALLALDLALARRSALPLVIGVAANVYLLAVLILATWVEARGVVDEVDPYSYDYEPPLGLRLVGVYLLAFVVVRAAAAGSWALISLGRRGGLPVARVVGIAAAALLGLAAVLLTLHLAITPFGIEVGDLYWRVAVAIVVLAALAACVTTLLYWSRRQLERPVLQPAHQPVAAAPWPQHAGQQQGWQQAAPHQGAPQHGYPQQAHPQQGWPGGAWPPPAPQPPRDQGAVPNPMQPQPTQPPTQQPSQPPGQQQAPPPSTQEQWPPPTE